MPAEQDRPADTPQALRDRAATSACEAVLRREWGQEYERRIAWNLWALETQFGEQLAEDLLYARLDDGRRPPMFLNLARR